MALAQRSILTAAVVLFAYLVGNEIQFACMNVDFEPAFDAADRPENARTYLEGSLGVLRPRYFHHYLFWAYRRLAGLDFSEKERIALVPWEYEDPPPQTQAIEHYKGPSQIWVEAQQVANPQAQPRLRTRWDGQDRRLRTDSWESYLNCPDSALVTAAQTLRDRVGRFGAQSAEAREWLKGQEVVFSNCEEGREIPEAAPPGLDPLIVKDRAYQIAAAHFYSQGFDEAARRFEAIAQDPDSPWRKWGAYLAARCYIRKGTLVQGAGQTDLASLREAKQRLQRVIDDPALAELHNSAKELLDFVLLRLEPEAIMARLSDELLSKNAGEWLPEIWTDYDWLLDRGHRPSRQSDLTDWILAFRGDGWKSPDAIVQRWRETGSLPWLVVSLAKIDANHAAVEELLKAAAAVPRQSPGYLTVSYDRLRLLAASKRDDEARAGLDEILSGPTLGLSRTVRNKFLEMRLPLSQDFDSFLKAARRQTLRDRPGALPLLLDADSLVPLNEELPLSRLMAAARSEILDQNIRKQIALAAWARAALIEKQEEEQQLRPLVVAHWPELRGELGKYAAQSDAEARRFALAFLLLRNPGIRPYVMVTVRREISFQEREQPPQEIDMFRENWWCSFDQRPLHEANYLKRSRYRPTAPAGATARPRQSQTLSFLSAQDRAEAHEELSKLFAIPPGPNYLSDQAVRWGRSHPDDPRVPEALHLAVQSTRVGCEDNETTKFSRAAFRLLHQLYPNSEWAKKTKYWY